MKKAMLFLFIFSMNAFAAKNLLDVQFPRENGLYFLAATSSEISQNLDKKVTQERALALCRYLGFRNLMKATSKVLKAEQLKVNDVQKGNLVTVELSHHAVINKLQCSK